MLYEIALTQLSEIGPVLARNLVSYCSGVEKIFSAKQGVLEKIPGIGSVRAKAIVDSRQNCLIRAEREIKFIEKHRITPLWYLNADYPIRLQNCNDAPLLLYYRGTTDLNKKKTIAIVGTRNMTDYGRMVIEKLMAELSPFAPLIISGLAYGVDITAHKAALKNNLDTVAVVANGMDQMYPKAHLKTAKEMLEQGGILTEYMSGAIADRENFPQRNRIVAGMCDATILIESAIKGGALITAALANGYNRDVFAFPGEVNKTYSQGCNYLIKTNQAHLVDNADDIISMLNWDQSTAQKKNIQRDLFVNLSDDEQTITEVLREKDAMDIDSICIQSKLSNTSVASALLMLELNGMVQALPGKLFKLV